MSFRSLTIKNPTGGTTLKPGDEITRIGDTWRVDRVTERRHGDTIVSLSPVVSTVPKATLTPARPT